MNSSVEMPAINMTSKATAWVIPGSTTAHTHIATAARNTSTIIPAAPTRARCHLLRNFAASEEQKMLDEEMLASFMSLLNSGYS